MLENVLEVREHSMMFVKMMILENVLSLAQEISQNKVMRPEYLVFQQSDMISKNLNNKVLQILMYIYHLIQNYADETTAVELLFPK